jgi:hypothetical protein
VGFVSGNTIGNMVTYKEQNFQPVKVEEGEILDTCPGGYCTFVPCACPMSANWIPTRGPKLPVCIPPVPCFDTSPAYPELKVGRITPALRCGGILSRAEKPRPWNSYWGKAYVALKEYLTTMLKTRFQSVSLSLLYRWQPGYPELSGRPDC